MKVSRKVLLVGNPNVGKSTLFNILCNRNQKTGNYAGVTVASLKGDYIYNGKKVEVTDLPGAYSIYPGSEDEMILTEFLIQEQSQYDGIIYVADALNLKRSFLLFEQIRDLGLPALLVINQIDQATKSGYTIYPEVLEKEYGVKVLLTNAKKNVGIEELRRAVDENLFCAGSPLFDIPSQNRALVDKIAGQTGEENLYKIWTMLSSTKLPGTQTSLIRQVSEYKETECLVPKRLQTQETLRRYEAIEKKLSEARVKKPQRTDLLTEKWDKLLVHPFWGYVFFLFILLIIFQSVFYLAEFPMAWIEDGFGALSEAVSSILPEGPLNNLIADGIIPGIGGIVVFAPQIGILLYFLYLLEDSGYMARVVFLMDRLLRPFGLNGKSIVPLVSATACAIPAIMTTRNIENIKERLITILVTPFMTCSARLPVYSIIITLVIPDKCILGISYKALALLAMYLLGFVTALMSAFVLKNIIHTKMKSFLVMDLPTYKMPMWSHNLKLTLLKVWGFITGAGKVIFAVSIVIWVLSYFGPNNTPGESSIKSEVELNDSYLAQMGRKMEPAIAPLGYDWKMGVGILTSFAAREVFVGTMSTLYSLSDNDPDARLIDKMRNDTKPNGEKVFTLATGLSILVFYAFAMQCISTVAIVYRETKSLKWTIAQLVGMSALAYVASFVVYQLFK